MTLYLEQQLFSGIRRAALIFAGIGFLMVATAHAQSSRPGWGATPYHDGLGTGVTFRVWAPNATSVTVPGTFNGWNTSAAPLGKDLTNGVWNGVWSADVASATNGSQYKFFMSGNLWKQDPRARLVQYSGSGGNSIIYDPTAFNWGGDNFTNSPQNDLFVYELHIGTFPSSSVPSKFVAATNKLDYLKSLGVNAVELMPIAEFPGDNSWGYNLAQIFAVENIGYGGPDGLKIFVKACHDRGIAVLLDVVHNHYGPSDLEMWNFDGFAGNNALGGGGIYFYQSNTNLQITPYGATRPNFNSSQVCNFVQDNFTMWLNECHVDGFRWDTPNLMMHDNLNNYIPAADTLIHAINDMIHTNYTGKISISEDVYNYAGFNSAWDTDLPYSVTPVLAAASDSSRDMNVVANAVQHNVRYGGTAGSGRVAFLETHDVTGDLNNGKRLVTAIDSATPNSYRARKLSTLGAIVTLTSPGVPMIFQGQEMLENQQFSSTRLVDWTKTNTYSGIVQLYRDLIGARRDLKGYTPGLEGDQCSMLWVDNSSKLVAFHRWSSTVPSQDAVVIANFANVNYSSYSLNFPSAGTWYVHFNSDSTNYGSDYGNAGSSVVTATGSNPETASVAIGPYSALILSQTPDAPPQLTITPAGSGVNISWPSTYSAWVLDASPTLAGSATPWNQVPAEQYQTSGTNIFINVSAPSGNTYYRLRKS
jgi:1,4-alpha-glucan branching enzyme